ncbi:penicillin-binding protein 1A [Rhodopila sp.]|jgi:penicillin-binding protein 1A|uniref:penicillin-binding protein 1A n=1 Tax=Rhodopila sp. TaxID=2480087 RepID=UPI002C5B8692|nr:PBP1A family penicillin-binding protein [Rhodopila sp.]HVZ08438.1 PBP1A family penicillin-binding protein [Rhodopila sp.]
MKRPLTAGERLSPQPASRRGAQQSSEPSTQGPHQTGSKRPRKRKPNLLVRAVNGLFGAMLAIVVLVGIAGAGAIWIAYRHFSADLPDVDGLRNYQPPVMSRVFAGDSRLLTELATERRIFVPITAIPPLVRQAFISAEDQNFYTHAGVDPLAIARAAVFDLTHYGSGKRPVGASTITQQVAKNMLLDNQMSMARKIKEAILATRIEENLTKDRILELYLNEIYLGLGAYGVAAAAQAYFNKPLDQLTLAETAFLAALPKAPNNFNPFKYPDAARARRDYVLDRMLDDRIITAQQAAAAKAEPIVPSAFRRPPPIPGADWFTEEVRRQLIARFGGDMTTQGGLMVRTSLDPVLQAAADKALREGLITYDRRYGGWRGPVGHLMLAPTDFDTRWPAALGEVQRPAGMLPAWRLAVVASTSDQEARLVWLDPAGERRSGTLMLSDLGWARPVRDGKMGAAPRRISDVVQTGDVVMVEPPASAAAPPPIATKGKQPAAPPASRLVLRQIPTVQGALVSMDPRTGRVLAMVGGWSFEQSQFNRATQAQRQPGSSFKPIVYLSALEKGVSPSQRFMDAPLVVDTPDGRWRPGNYELTFNGPTPLRIALEESLNLVTLRVAQHVGMQAVADTAIAFHMVDSMPKVLPAALGAVDTTVLREAGAYASFAMAGREVVPTLIDSVQDRDGHVVMRAPGLNCDNCGDAATPPTLTDDRKQIADAASVFQLVTMMQGVVQRGTGYEAGKGLNRPIAGKTGTTQDFNDAWFTGFTPDIVTAVWVGFDTPASLGNNETGGRLAAPIWRDYMTTALQGRPVLNFPMPPGVTMAQWDTGHGPRTDAFKDGQVPGASAGTIGGGGGGVASSGDTGGGGGGPAPGGVDTNLGGLY